MKQYPSIQYWNKGRFGEKVWAFDKLDGSQIRIEWSKKRGFYKFGSKGVLLDENTPIFGKAKPLFLNKYSADLEKVFRNTKEFRNTENFIIFAEFFGKNTFAGLHEEKDDYDVVIFDISQYKKGFLTPKMFLQHFDHLHIAQLMYEGNYNKQLVEDVFNQKGYKLKEGLVCKGTTKTKGQDLIWMVKLKTQEWLLKVKERHGMEALLKEVNNDKGVLNL